MSDNNQWVICIDRGDGNEDPVVSSNDLNHIFIRIGQLVLSLGIEKIIVHCNGQEYRRYVLHRHVTEEEENII